LGRLTWNGRDAARDGAGNENGHENQDNTRDFVHVGSFFSVKVRFAFLG
jgi:hypothetical protein